MKNLRALLIVVIVTVAIGIPRVVSPGHAATVWNVNSGQSTATIQGVVNGASANDMVVFAAGTYNLTGQLTLKCGVTYTGPVVKPATAILNGSGAGIGAGNGLLTLNTGAGLANPCTQPTTIAYLAFSGTDTGIYVRTSFTNLTIQHNQFINIPGRVSQTAAIVFESGTTTSNTASTLSNTLIDWNQFGDSNSCISPTNVMTFTGSPETYEGACNGMVFFTSINGLTVTNNSFFHIAEGVHINCPNYAHQTYPCEPPGGAITKNIVVKFNDFSNIHRINWEQQAQQNSGEIWEYNTSHDFFTPYFGTYGLSMACCYNGTSPPNMNASNNVVLFNVGAGTHGRYGYGMEAMGKNAIFDHELLQAASSSSNAPGMAWGCGNVSSMSNNTVQGNFGGYIVQEGSFPCGTVTTPALSGNVTGSSISTITSVAPTLPPSGYQIGPITVTDPGFTSGPQPLGNTSIYCTTDGSTPTVNSPLYTGPLSVVYPATLKCIGMFGTGANLKTYPSGYGFVPSAVVSASYTSAAAAATPAFSPGSSSFATSLSVSISDATVGATIYYTTDGSTPTTASSVYTGPITVTGASTVIKAIATHAGNSQSAIATATYISTTIVSVPTFSPSDGTTFPSSLSVSIADLTPSSTIYYTTDGSTPTTGSTAYTGPITLSGTTTVKAIATASGLTTSAAGSATYTQVGSSVTATPAATPVAGTYFASQSVSLSDSTPSSTICYTTDGSTPAAATAGTCSHGTTYSGAITVSSSETINALGTASGMANSGVATFPYVISAPTPSQRGNIDYTQIKALERLGPGNYFQMANKGTYSAVNAATPCNPTNEGATAAISDSNTATYGAAAAGGGSNHVHAFCNGSAWIVD